MGGLRERVICQLSETFCLGTYFHVQYTSYLQVGFSWGLKGMQDMLGILMCKSQQQRCNKSHDGGGEGVQSMAVPV